MEYGVDAPAAGHATGRDAAYPLGAVALVSSRKKPGLGHRAVGMLEKRRSPRDGGDSGLLRVPYGGTLMGEGNPIRYWIIAPVDAVEIIKNE